MQQANIGLLGAWRAAGNTGDLPAGWNGPGGDSSSSSGGGNIDVIANAQKLLDFQKTANEPVASALGSQVPGIQQQYSDLVNKIKLGSEVAGNSATLNFNNEYARRGLSGNSGLYQTDLANTLLPVNSDFSGQLAGANAGSIQDLQGLALQMAQLRAGNPETAITGGLQIGGLQNQSQSLALQQLLGTLTTTPANILSLAQAKYLGGQTQGAVSTLAQQFGLY